MDVGQALERPGFPPEAVRKEELAGNEVRSDLQGRGTGKGWQRETSRVVVVRMELCSIQHELLSRRTQEWGCEKKRNKLRERQWAGQWRGTQGLAVLGLISCTAQENGVVSSTEKFNINEKALATGHVLVPKEGRREDELVSL